MHLSWSHKLFLHINQFVGKNKGLDNFMIFCAKWLIYLIGLFLFLWIIFTTKSELIFGRVLFIIVVILCSYGVSLLIAGIMKKSRPQVEIPTIKQLIHTIGLWKSFPSDHTNISFLMVFVAIILGLSVYLYIPLLICAGFVALSRVYCGVHYPRDILGGIILAVLFTVVTYIFVA